MQIINAWYFIICHHKKLKSFIFLSFIKGNAIMLMRTLCGFHFKRCFKCFIPFIEEDLTSELRYLNEIQKNARWYIGIFWKFVIKNQQLNKERFFFARIYILFESVFVMHAQSFKQKYTTHEYELIL